jgi:hypothetical protein
MEKVIRDGKVAVIISTDFGAGWYTWNTEHQEILFSPKVVEMIENGNSSLIDEDWVRINLGIDDFYVGSSNESLTINWLPIGTRFKVDEYDGAESLTLFDDLCIVA